MHNLYFFVDFISYSVFVFDRHGFRLWSNL